MEWLFIAAPGFIGLVALFILATGVRDLVLGGRLATRGLPARGEVLHSHVRSYGADDSRRPHRVESIGFTTASGQTIRDTPLVADIGMTDRLGQTVAVLYDRDRPEQFIAPKDGRRLSPTKPLVKIGFCLAILVFVGVFTAFALIMMRAVGI